MSAVLRAELPGTYPWLAPGLHEGVPAHEYHHPQLRPYVHGKGSLDQVARSPLHWQAWAAGEVATEETPALLLGRAFHALLLEPDSFDAEFAIAPEGAPRRPTERQINAKDPSPETVFAVKFWAEWNAETAGKAVLDADQWAQLQAMRAAVLKHPIAAKIIGTGRSEVTSVWRDDSGLLIKNRIDYLVAGTRYAMDLKSTFDAAAQPFARSIVNYRYHVQDALYTEGLKRNGFDLRAFCFLAVEKSPPYAPAIYLLDAAAHERGWELARRDLDALARAIETNEFPAYSGRIETLSLPGYAFTD